MAEENKVLSWGENWDQQPMSQIEQTIKNAVNSKITMGGLPVEEVTAIEEGSGETPKLPSYILTLDSIDGTTFSWLAGVIKQEDLLKDIQNIKENGATIEFLKPIKISTSGTDGTGVADIVANSISAGTITFTDSLSGSKGDFTAITGDITTDQIEIFGKTIVEGQEVISKDPVILITQNGITANSGNFDTLYSEGLSATTVTSENLVGSKLYIGEAAVDPGNTEGDTPTWIDISPTHFTTPTLTATTASIDKLTIGKYDALNGYSTDLQYRPIRFTNAEPTGSNYTPGTLIAVLKSST